MKKTYNSLECKIISMQNDILTSSVGISMQDNQGETRTSGRNSIFGDEGRSGRIF